MNTNTNTRRITRPLAYWHLLMPGAGREGKLWLGGGATDVVQLSGGGGGPLAKVKCPRPGYGGSSSVKVVKVEVVGGAAAVSCQTIPVSEGEDLPPR